MEDNPGGIRFWAHSDRTGLRCDAPGNDWQLLAVHLQNVSRVAGELAKQAAPDHPLLARIADEAGLLHDLGKYQPCFQKMLQTGRRRKCPHSLYGAIAAAINLDGSPRHEGMLSAFAVAAHHAGLDDLARLESKLDNSDEQAVRAMLWRDAQSDQPALAKWIAAKPAALALDERQRDLFTRILLSCLVDADRLDTAGLAFRQMSLDAPVKLEQLLRRLDALALRATETKQSSAIVTGARNAVQLACAEAAADDTHNLFSLSVPTGGGKTLAAMRFALERAAAHPERYRRIIVVIPYLSIIEQNAEIYRNIFGADALLEHHSGVLALRNHQMSVSQETNEEAREVFVPMDEQEKEPDESLHRLETENWDHPLIVTTSVRLFESLFSNHPSDLRRVHNIARSIIILDEVQTLPSRLLAPLLAMMRELSEDWGCTLVMATATQPAFEKLPENHAKTDVRWEAGTVREIIHNPAQLHAALRRVTFDWRLEQPVSWEQVAGWMQQHPQALCVVNKRDHAAQLYRLLRQDEEADEGSVIHLSTRMCAAHRLETVHRIRERLNDGLPCKVVSTQLIEAGVDVDFPIAYRALGPLDSVIQVAGRVDREGTLTAALGSPGGKLVIFLPEDASVPPGAYRTATDITRSIANDIHPRGEDMQALRRYFDTLYANTGTGAELQEYRDELMFRTLAGKFELINSRMQDVFVPYGEGHALIEELIEKLKSKKGLDRALLHKLQRYTVGLWPWELRTAKERGSVYEARADSGLWLGRELFYDLNEGLVFEPRPESMVV